MSFLPIYRTLNADAAVKAILGTDLRVYEDLAPLDTPTPYAVWQEVGGSAENSLDCPAKTDHVMYQVIVYDTNQKRAYEAREAIRKALETQSYILNPRISNYETDTKLYSRGFDANWFLDR
ncbi:DUF3168 domain-containing protein [Acinetobacter pittii]|uniref:DUF3168 domain-containing protein n=1 Tax=Acinetobacter pittii TaxID=48296 RepID=UPI002A005D02|nr:DUF3168 domain-containing protein [Acinetobacter pittii]MDX8160974.1 DUF3168 domain-containing protein [Acinetobacter pittii]MDX8265511.1 DUF3168 domain-containing protein [Acinetobacter pittii]